MKKVIMACVILVITLSCNKVEIKFSEYEQLRSENDITVLVAALNDFYMKPIEAYKIGKRIGGKSVASELEYKLEDKSIAPHTTMRELLDTIRSKSRIVSKELEKEFSLLGYISYLENNRAWSYYSTNYYTEECDSTGCKDVYDYTVHEYIFNYAKAVEIHDKISEMFKTHSLSYTHSIKTATKIGYDNQYAIWKHNRKALKAMEGFDEENPNPVIHSIYSKWAKNNFYSHYLNSKELYTNLQVDKAALKKVLYPYTSNKRISYSTGSPFDFGPSTYQEYEEYIFNVLKALKELEVFKKKLENIPIYCNDTYTLCEDYVRYHLDNKGKKVSTKKMYRNVLSNYNYFF